TLLRSGRPGPVMLEIPVDVAAESLEKSLDYKPPIRIRSEADRDAARDAVRLLREAQRPIILAGQGARYAQGPAEPTRPGQRLAAPVVTTMLGKSGFNERHPLSLGTAAYARTDTALRRLQQCDLIFAVGTSLSTGIFAPKIPAGKRFIHATVDPRDINKDQ